MQDFFYLRFIRYLKEIYDSQNLILHHYTDTQEYKEIIAKHIVDRLIRFDVLNHLETDARFQKYYKQIILALQSIMDGHLLC